MIVFVLVFVHEFVSMRFLFLCVHVFACVDVLLLRVCMTFASVRVVTLCVHTLFVCPCLCVCVCVCVCACARAYVLNLRMGLIC